MLSFEWDEHKNRSNLAKHKRRKHYPNYLSAESYKDRICLLWMKGMKNHEKRI